MGDEDTRGGWNGGWSARQPGVEGVAVGLLGSSKRAVYLLFENTSNYGGVIKPGNIPNIDELIRQAIPASRGGGR